MGGILKHRSLVVLATLVVLIVVVLGIIVLGGPEPTAFNSPLPTIYTVHLPSMTKESHVYSPKKGTWGAWGTSLCPFIRNLGLGWHFESVDCGNAEWIDYLATPAQLLSRIPLSDFALFLNEPDIKDADWKYDPISQHVSAFIAAETASPNTGWGGPCISQNGLPYLISWFAEYQAQTGQPFQPAALCYHCYGSLGCEQGDVEAVHAFGVAHGVQQMVVTELNGGSIQATGDFVAWLESKDWVILYGYWPGVWHPLFAGTETFWPPLIKDGVVTEHGEAFANMPWTPTPTPTATPVGPRPLTRVPRDTQPSSTSLPLSLVIWVSVVAVLIGIVMWRLRKT